MEIKKLDDAVTSSNARVDMVLKGQLKEAEAFPKADEKRHAEVERLKQITIEAKQHAAEFAHQWLSDRNLTLESLTDDQATEYNATIDAERNRWAFERLAQLEAGDSGAQEKD